MRDQCIKKCDSRLNFEHFKGVLVGVFTMTATWVGGGYINGTGMADDKPREYDAYCMHDA